MPRLNGPAWIAAGVDGLISLTQPPAPPQYLAEGYRASWLDDDHLIFQNKHDDALWTYQISTKQFTPVPGGNLGGNELAAGGGLWAAWRPDTGVYAPGFVAPAAGLAGAGSSTDGRGSSSEGITALIPDRSVGFGLDLVDAAGRPTYTLPTANARSAQVVSAAQAVWVQDGQIAVAGLTVPTPQPQRVAAVRTCELLGRRYLLLTLDDKVILREWDSTLGFTVVPGPTGFHADLTPVAGRYLRVCWSTTSGERPEDIRYLDIDPARQLTEDTGAVDPGPPQPEPPKPEPEPPIPPDPTPIPPKPEPPAGPFPRPPAEPQPGVPMDPIRRALRMGEFFIAAAPELPEPYPGWTAVRWGTPAAPVDPGSPEALFEITQPSPTSPKLLVKSVATGRILNADLTASSGNLSSALALKPTTGGTDGWDSYEQWNGYTLRNRGEITALVMLYDRDGQEYTGVILTLVAVGG